MKISFLGHASIKLDDLIVDPWTKEIPGFGLKPSYDFSASDRKANVLCISHNHPDHRLGAEELATENKATIVAGFELAGEFASKGLNVEMMNTGGRIQVSDWSIFMTKAFHSGSSNPNGFILQKGGLTLYHAGDTSFFSGMNALGEKFHIDVAFLPIGDRFTMGIDEAVRAAKALKPKIVVPIHYNTFPMIAVNDQQFKAKIEALGLQCKILKPGESMVL